MHEHIPPSASPYPLSIIAQGLLSLIAFFLVAFGQPAWLPWNGLVAAAIGYALFWRVLLAYPLRKQRFWMAFAWFFAVQLVQMSWFLSHPFWYIYSVYLFICIMLGLQFGLVSMFISPRLLHLKSPLRTVIGFLAIAAMWTIFEWSRLFLLSGLSWNPVGLALTSSLYALQPASVVGIFGLSFWVILVNLLALYAWIQLREKPAIIALWLLAAALPYLYGAMHVQIHEQRMTAQKNQTPILTAVLVQTAFPVEETGDFSEKKSLLEHVKDEWRQILQITKKHQGKKIDMIVLPEFVVPFGTYSFAFSLSDVATAFNDIMEPKNLDFLPAPHYPFVTWQNTPRGLVPLVNNAYWVQAIANYFQADVVVGLEDAEQVSSGVIEYYSSAQFTHPQNKASDDMLFATRYAKQVLVPMGEYIPFSFCQKLAERYGIFGSFTCGKGAVVMMCSGVPFSPSVCYEETYGHIIKEGRQKGADLLVNLTSDVWYPNSKLPMQHFDHARLRTVENGVPLIRACNTGITAAIDSLGRTIAVLGGEHPEEVEWVPDSLIVDVPIYTYKTLYSQHGDKLIIGLSFLILLCSALYFFKHRQQGN